MCMSWSVISYSIFPNSGVVFKSPSNAFMHNARNIQFSVVGAMASECMHICFLCCIFVSGPFGPFIVCGFSDCYASYESSRNRRCSAIYGLSYVVPFRRLVMGNLSGYNDHIHAQIPLICDTSMMVFTIF